MNAKHTWVLGFPKCPQDPIYLLLGIHTGVARPGLGVDGPPSCGGSFFFTLLHIWGLSTGPTVPNGAVQFICPLPRKSSIRISHFKKVQ